MDSDDYQDIRSNKMRIFLASWLLITVVIVNSYASRLASYLTLPIYEKSINSFGDLAQRPDVPLTIAVDSVFLETLNVRLCANFV